MNFLNLYYFLTAAEELNFTRAAKRLFISQQSLSNHIAKLEKEYGVTLFDRGVPMTLTAAGEVLLETAREVTDMMGQCEQRMQDIKDFRKGKLSIGIPVTRGTIMLPQLFAAFHQMYPQMRLEIFEGSSSSEVDQALYDGKVDLAIGYALPDDPGVISTPLYEERLILLAPNRLLSDYFTASQVKKMKQHPQPISIFAECPFIAQNQSTMGGRLFASICREAQMEPRIVLVTQNILTQINLCSVELGFCTVPNSFVVRGSLSGEAGTFGLFSGHEDGRITTFDLASRIGGKPLGINRLRRKMLTQAGKEFIQLAQAMYA